MLYLSVHHNTENMAAEIEHFYIILIRKNYMYKILCT